MINIRYFVLLSSAVFFFQQVAHSAPLALHLNDAVDRGLKENLSVLASKYNLSISEAEALSAGLRANPSLFLDSQLMPFGPNWDQTSSAGPVQRDIVLSVPIDATGKREKAAEAARALSRQVRLEFYDFQRLKALEIRSLYVNTLLNRTKIDLLKQKIKSLESAVSLITNRIGGSRVQPLLQTRLQLSLKKSRMELTQVEEQESISIRELRRQLHLENSEELHLETSFKKIELPHMHSENEILQEALSRRPDYLARLENQKYLKLQEKALSAQVWDDVIVSAGVTRQEKYSASPSNPASTALPGAWSYLVGVNIPLPVFNKRQGDRVRNSLLSNQGEIAVKDMKIKIQTELTNSLASIKRQNSQIAGYETDLLKSAERLRESAERSFGSGSSTVFEFLDSLDSSHLVVLSYFELLAEHANSIFTLEAQEGEI